MIKRKPTAEQWKALYASAVRQHQQDMQRIHDKQKRDQAERVTIYAVKTPDGQFHESTDYKEVEKAATFYYDATIVTRTTTPWKPITVATTDTNTQDPQENTNA